MRQQWWRQLQRLCRRRWRIKSGRRHIHIPLFFSQSSSRTMIKTLHHYFWICCVATCNLQSELKSFMRDACACVLFSFCKSSMRWKWASNGPLWWWWIVVCARERESFWTALRSAAAVTSIKATKPTAQAAVPLKWKTFVIILPLLFISLCWCCCLNFHLCQITHTNYGARKSNEQHDNGKIN